MKYFIASMFLSIQCLAGSVVTDPATTADNTITPTANSVVSMTINGVSGSQPALYVSNQQTYDAIQGNSLNGAGVYGYSANFVGVLGGSLTGNAGYFQSNSSSNISATVLVQSIGSSSANLLEFQSVGGSVISSVDNGGVFHASNALQLDTAGSKPICSSTTRGTMFVVRGGTGVADLLQICMKASSGSYSWVTK